MNEPTILTLELIDTDTRYDNTRWMEASITVRGVLVEQDIESLLDDMNNNRERLEKFPPIRVCSDMLWEENGGISALRENLLAVREALTKLEEGLFVRITWRTNKGEAGDKYGISSCTWNIPVPDTNQLDPISSKILGIALEYLEECAK